jgi:hypothetical protein
VRERASGEARQSARRTDEDGVRVDVDDALDVVQELLDVQLREHAVVTADARALRAPPERVWRDRVVAHAHGVVRRAHEREVRVERGNRVCGADQVQVDGPRRVRERGLDRDGALADDARADEHERDSDGLGGGFGWRPGAINCCRAGCDKWLWGYRIEVKLGVWRVGEQRRVEEVAEENE